MSIMKKITIALLLLLSYASPTPRRCAILPMPRSLRMMQLFQTKSMDAHKGTILLFLLIMVPHGA